MHDSSDSARSPGRTTSDRRRRLAAVAAAVLAAAGTVLVTAPPAAAAVGPTVAGTVVTELSTSGAAVIDNSVADTTTITLSGRTVLTWGAPVPGHDPTFSLPSGTVLNFVFSSPGDTVLIRADDGPATVGGRINSYLGGVGGPPGGSVWITSDDGVGISSGSTIDVGGFLATTAGIADADFLSGNINFASAPSASSVLVQGAAITGRTDLVAFVAPTVLQDVASSVTGAGPAEVLFGAASAFSLALDGSGGQRQLRSFTVPAGVGAATPAPAPLDLNGSISGSDVFIASVASSATAGINVGSPTTTGSLASGDGQLVVSAGAGLTRSGGVLPMGPSAVPGTPAQGIAPLQPLSASSTSVFATGNISTTQPVTATAGEAVLRAGGSLAVGAQVRAGTDASLGAGSTLTVQQPVTAGTASGDQAWLQAGGNLSLGAPVSGHEVIMRTRGNLTNTGGETNVVPGAGGRWIVYAPAPANVAGAGLDSGQNALWGSASTDWSPARVTGKRYVFEQERTLTFTSANATKVFPDVFTAPFSFTHDGAARFDRGLSGQFTADTAGTVFTGTPGYASPGAMDTAKELANGGTYPIDISQGTLTSLSGYDFAFADTGALFVDDTTPPEVTPVLTPPPGSPWFTTDVDLAWSVVDEGSEVVTPGPGCAPVQVRQDQPSTPYTCTATSLGVGQTEVSVDIARDATAPVLTVAGTTETGSGAAAPYESGTWTNKTVEVDFDCTDLGFSGVASMPADETVTGGTPSFTDATCADVAGNVSDPVSFEVKVDKVAPVVSQATAVTTADGLTYGEGNWVNRQVTVSWSCTDEAGGSGALDPTVSVRVASEGPVVPTCVDLAGNRTQGDAFQVNVDMVAPVLHDLPADITIFAMTGPVTATWTDPEATDAHLDGAVSCSPSSGAGFPLATDAASTTTPVACSARDLAGNVATGTFDVTVTRLGVTFDGPVDAPSVMNVAKLGRVIPVKATVTVGGVPHTGPSSVPISVGLSRVVCGSTVTDGLETYAAAGSSNTGNLFRWDATARRWAYNLDTGAAGATSNSCYRVAVYHGGSVTGGIASGGTLAGSFLLQTKR